MGVGRLPIKSVNLSGGLEGPAMPHAIFNRKVVIVTGAGRNDGLLQKWSGRVEPLVLLRRVR